MSLTNKLPQHIAIVMDGNGRWAQSRGLLRIEGHTAGIHAVRTVIRCCLKKKIGALSLFTFSSENWLRPQDEVDFLMQLFLTTLRKEIEELHQNAVCLRFTGNREGLSAAIRQEMELAEQLTAANRGLILNLVVNYGGKWDIVEAAKKIAVKVKEGQLQIEQVNENTFAHHLATEDLIEPDLFIRTSGERRISNFFLWQHAYTELYFTATHWPDFSEQEFNKALQSFAQRERRYGKTSCQVTEEDYV